MKHKPTKDELSDMALFQAEMADIEPLSPDQRVIIKPEPPQPMTTFNSKPEAHFIDSHYSEGYEPQTLGNEEFLSFQRSGIQHSLFKQLRNGQLKTEAQLDLHGMTISIAHQQLADFIYECRKDRLRCVRIIHGKGWGSKDNKPILKTKLNAWLQQEDNVLAFCSTPIEDGGTGAVYVLLRRIKA